MVSSGKVKVLLYVGLSNIKAIANVYEQLPCYFIRLLASLLYLYIMNTLVFRILNLVFICLD
jgi:hypothetical protein